MYARSHPGAYRELLLSALEMVMSESERFLEVFDKLRILSVPYTCERWLEYAPAEA